MVVSTDPGSSGDHGHDSDDNGDNTPAEDDFWCVVRHMVLEGAHDGVDEPGDTRDGASRVNTTEMLQETSQEHTPPQRGPLQG